VYFKRISNLEYEFSVCALESHEMALHLRALFFKLCCQLEVVSRGPRGDGNMEGRKWRRH
jgi:hypothetical protein